MDWKKPVDDLTDGEIQLVLKRACEADPEKQWLPAYYFDICLMDGTVVGYCDLRIGLNAKVYIGGNLGYGIAEEYRGHHYAEKATRLLMKQARKHDMDFLFASCVPGNEASRRTLECAGFHCLETAAVPKSHNMYEEGKHWVLIHRIDL